MEDSKPYRIITGNSNPKLAESIAKCMDAELTKATVEYFANGEIRPQIFENVRDKRVYIIQTGVSNSEHSINDHIMEAYLLACSCRRAGSSKITLCMPCYPYARQDKKDSPRATISAADVAKLFEVAGVRRAIFTDLHSACIQGFFTIPVDNLYCVKGIKDHLLKNEFIGLSKDEISNGYVAVSPDEGAHKRTSIYSSIIGLDMVSISKERDLKGKNTVKEVTLIGDSRKLRNKTAILFDDMLDTGGTIIKVVELLGYHDVSSVLIVISHGIFSGPALERINNCDMIKNVITSDSLPQEHNQLVCKKIQVFSIADMYADAITRLETGESISEMFNY